MEMAVALPVFLLLLFGFLEMSRTSMIRNAMRIASYEAARAAIVPGATSSKAEVVANTHLQSAMVRYSTVTIDPEIITADTELVTATVSVPYASNAWFLPCIVPNITFEATCTLTREPTFDNY